jgi:hypothetical protein
MVRVFVREKERVMKNLKAMGKIFIEGREEGKKWACFCFYS